MEKDTGEGPRSQQFGAPGVSCPVFPRRQGGKRRAGMKGALIFGAIVLVLAISIPVNAFELKISKALLFGAGLTTGFVIHEGGHWTMGKLRGRDLKWHWDPTLRYSYEGESDIWIQMAGLMANALFSELILLIPKEKRGPYLNGVLIFNVLEEFAYPVFRHTGGDFGSLSHGERWTWGSIFVAHSLLTTYRIYRAGHLNLKTWVGVTEKGTPMGGFKISW